jgi:tetratricopeptide (TPR) repeat protein
MNLVLQNLNSNPREFPNSMGTIVWFFGTVVLAGLTGCNLNADRHNITGIQAFQTGQTSQAINEFQRALTANPNNANAYYNLGVSYSALAKQTKNQQLSNQAEQLFRQAISLNGQHAEAHRALAALLVETGREQYAFDLLQQWQQRSPGQTQPLVELARLYQEYGDNRRASDLLTDALKLDSNCKVALQALGHVRESQGQYQLAMENYLRVLQLDPSQTDVANQVARLQTRLAQQPASVNPNLPPPRYGSTIPNTPR